MTINKYQGRTKDEAVEKAKQEMGSDAVVLNVKEIRPKGMFRIFKGTTYEVTAAVDEKEPFVNPLTALNIPQKTHESISLAAGEKITIPAAKSGMPEEQRGFDSLERLSEADFKVRTAGYHCSVRQKAADCVFYRADGGRENDDARKDSVAL